MAEANIANTSTIYGRTNYLNVTNFNQVLLSNEPASNVVYKVNSIFIANKDPDYAVDVDLRIVRIVGSGANAEVKYFYLTRAITIPRDATLIAVCRDNPVYLQQGDMIQVRAGETSRADAVASYEIISDTEIVPPTLTVPSAPLNLTAEPANAMVLLYWDAPTATGGTPVVDYVVQVAERTDSTVPWPTFVTISKPESPTRAFSFAATNSYEYRFRVAAVNGSGAGAWSANSNIVTPTSFSAPVGITAAAYNASVLLSWSEPADTASTTLTQYAIRWSVDDGVTWLPSRDGILTGGTTTTRTVLNLQNDLPYVFSVRGLSATISGAWSAPSATAVPTASASLPPINSANYGRAANWNATTDGNLLSVGTAGGTSVYGTYDMNGNVNEWLENRALETSSSADAYAPGGSFIDTVIGHLDSTKFISAGNGLNTTQYLSVADKVATCGFRLVSFEASPIVTYNNTFMTVGDTGNAAFNNVQLLRTFGTVSYSYKIQKYEVSNAEYVDFLNAVDPTGANALGLYDSNMTSNVYGGITYTAGADTGEKYTTKTNMASKPVNFVSWYSAIRYANWMHNGQGTGDTENGAYEFASPMSGTDSPVDDFVNAAVTPVEGTDSDLTLVRKTGAKYVLPTTHEWFKAAFYKGGGTNAGYWKYATQSNTQPSTVTATSTGNGVL